MFYEVIPARNGVGEILTYTFDSDLEVGTLVEVPIGKFRAAGVVVGKVAKPEFKCREITRVLYPEPLPKHLIKTAQWMAEYYQVPVTSALNMILPVGILKKRRKHGA